MSKKRLLNQTFLAVVSLGLTTILFSYSYVLAQQTNSEAEEQEIDLDSLDEDLEEPSNDESDNNEKYLPMNTALVELERNPALALVAMMVLMPLATLLVPLNWIRKGGSSQSRRNKKTNS